MTPPDWPQPHPRADDFDEFWVVHSLPPLPWPALPDGAIDHQAYGPTGTEWLFSVGDYINRLSMPGMAQALGTAFGRLLNEAKAVRVPFGQTWGWRTPASHDSPAGADWTSNRMSIKVVRATFHAKLGGLEEVAHVLHFRTAPVADVDQDVPALNTLAGQLITQWGNFLTAGSTDSGGTPIRGYLPQTLVYNELRLAYLTITPGQKPHYDIPTQYYPMVGAQFQGSAGAAGGSPIGWSLPYEVACVLSLGTSFRGPRHRGRIYLGPFAGGIMQQTPNVAATDGYFSPVVDQIGARFGQHMVAGVAAATGVRLAVLSQKYGESFPVTGVRVGRVPDSQRRRRRALVEGYTQAWGTAPGVAVPA